MKLKDITIGSRYACGNKTRFAGDRTLWRCVQALEFGTTVPRRSWQNGSKGVKVQQVDPETEKPIGVPRVVRPQEIQCLWSEQESFLRQYAESEEKRRDRNEDRRKRWITVADRLVELGLIPHESTLADYTPDGRRYYHNSPLSGTIGVDELEAMEKLVELAVEAHTERQAVQ